MPGLVRQITIFNRAGTDLQRQPAYRLVCREAWQAGDTLHWEK